MIYSYFFAIYTSVLFSVFVIVQLWLIGSYFETAYHDHLARRCIQGGKTQKFPDMSWKRVELSPFNSSSHWLGSCSWWNDLHFHHINTDLPKYLSRPSTSTHRSWITRFTPEFPKSLSNRKCATTCGRSSISDQQKFTPLWAHRVHRRITHQNSTVNIITSMSYLLFHYFFLCYFCVI